MLPISPTSTAPKGDLFSEIARLKKERNAVILAHYYQDPNIQDIADILGDSLALAKEAQKTTADVIVLCGVHFMAETAKILNPSKIVVLPDTEAGCSLADSCPPEAFKKFKEQHPDHTVVTYVNTSAAIKALSDWTCTSTNAELVIRAIPENQPIIFAPDVNLGRYLMQKTGRDMLLWQGSCIVHETFNERRILELLTQHPDAELIAHPECETPVLRQAHFIGSTQGLLAYSQKSTKQKFIVATEEGILHTMQKASPGKTFIPAAPRDAKEIKTCGCSTCPYMKLNTLEKVYACLRDLTPRIELEESLRLAALKPIERMMAVS
jgi:quinolinate synthase